jgi:hypothetical protein
MNWKDDGETALRRYRGRWEDNVKIYLQETGYKSVGWDYLTQNNDCGRLLWKQQKSRMYSAAEWEPGGTILWCSLFCLMCTKIQEKLSALYAYGAHVDMQNSHCICFCMAHTGYTRLRIPVRLIDNPVYWRWIEISLKFPFHLNQID